MNDSVNSNASTTVSVLPLSDDNPSWSRSVICGLVIYVASLIPIVSGVVAGFELLKPGREIPYGSDNLLLRFAAWDGGQFMSIMEHGYSYQPQTVSNIVLFPGYPLLGQLVKSCTGLSSAAALLLVSHLSLLAGMIFFHRLTRLRFGDDKIAAVCLMTLAVFPTTFFWRMAYSESPFVLVQVMFLYGIQRKWSAERLSILVGLATSLRLVGVAMLVPLAIEFCSKNDVRTNSLNIQKLSRLCFCMMLSLSGLGSFMLFQWIQFGDPLVFIRGQESFFLRQPVGTVEHWYRLATLEPIWGTYVPSSDCFWRRHSPSPGPLLNLQFWNPIWFCLTCGLVFCGWFYRRLTDGESALAAVLLLIPYLGRAEEFCMGCQGRYASAALPAMMVLGQLLFRRSVIMNIGLILAGVSLLTLYSAMFAAWYFLL